MMRAVLLVIGGLSEDADEVSKVDHEGVRNRLKRSAIEETLGLTTVVLAVCSPSPYSRWHECN